MYRKVLLRILEIQLIATSTRYDTDHTDAHYGLSSRLYIFDVGAKYEIIVYNEAIHIKLGDNELTSNCLRKI